MEGWDWVGFTKRTDRMSERNFSRATILREHSSLSSYLCSNRETVWRHGSAISRAEAGTGAHQRQEREKAAKRPMFGLKRPERLRWARVWGNMDARLGDRVSEW